MTTLTLQPDDTVGLDCWISSGAPTTNNNNTVLWIGAGIGRAWLKFDLSSIPADSIISSVTLSLTVKTWYGANTSILYAYRCLRAATETGATWNKFDGTTNWGTAGASNTTTDIDATALGSVTVTAKTANLTWDISLSVAEFTKLIDGTYTNNGFIIRNTENNDDADYYSSGGATASYRPKLVVEYSAPSASTFRPRVINL